MLACGSLTLLPHSIVHFRSESPHKLYHIVQQYYIVAASRAIEEDGIKMAQQEGIKLYEENPEWSLKEKIYQYCLYLRGSVTFAELRSKFKEHFNGKYTITPSEYPNIIVWYGMDKEFNEAIRELLNEKKLFLRPTSIMTYLADNGILDLPIAKKLYNYKKPHWLPMCLHLEE